MQFVDFPGKVPVNSGKYVDLSGLSPVFPVQQVDSSGHGSLNIIFETCAHTVVACAIFSLKSWRMPRERRIYDFGPPYTPCTLTLLYLICSIVFKMMLDKSCLPGVLVFEIQSNFEDFLNQHFILIPRYSGILFIVIICCIPIIFGYCIERNKAQFYIKFPVDSFHCVLEGQQ